MSQRLSYSVVVALSVGIAMQLAFAFAPDPGIGPSDAGLGALEPSVGGAVAIFSRNLLTVGVIAVGGIVTGWVVASGATSHARQRLVVYLLLLAGGYWAYFVSGVVWLASDLGISRPRLALELVHGWVEWPALLLPWAAVAFATRSGGRLDMRLIGRACACSVMLLATAAMLETFLVPDLLPGPGRSY